MYIIIYFLFLYLGIKRGRIDTIRAQRYIDIHIIILPSIRSSFTYTIGTYDYYSTSSSLFTILFVILITPITDRRVTPTLVRQYQISCGNQIITLNYQKILNVCAKIEYLIAISIDIYLLECFPGHLLCQECLRKIHKSV